MNRFELNMATNVLLESSFLSTADLTAVNVGVYKPNCPANSPVDTCSSTDVEDPYPSFPKYPDNPLPRILSFSL